MVPVALRHAISDRQIRGDPLINSLCIFFSKIAKANSYLRGCPPNCRYNMTYKLHCQTSLSIRGGKGRLLDLLIAAVQVPL